MQQAPKRHHFVPKMLQKHFLTDDGGLWAYDHRRTEQKVWYGKPDNLFLRGHLYSHLNEDGSKDAELENRFSRLESATAPIIDKILAAARMWRTPQLTVSERANWDLFLYQQFRRVPDFYASLLTEEQHKGTVEAHIDTFHRKVRPVTNKERSDTLDPSNLEKLYRNLRVSSLKSISRNVLAIIAGRGLAVCRVPNPKKSFILGSRPVIKLTPPETNDLRDPHVELWLAVAPDVMIGLGPLDEREVIVDINDRNLRLVNEAVAAQSSQIVGRSMRLVASLAPHVGRKIGK